MKLAAPKINLFVVYVAYIQICMHISCIIYTIRIVHYTHSIDTRKISIRKKKEQVEI